MASLARIPLAQAICPACFGSYGTYRSHRLYILSPASHNIVTVAEPPDAFPPSFVPGVATPTRQPCAELHLAHVGESQEFLRASVPLVGLTRLRVADSTNSLTEWALHNNSRSALVFREGIGSARSFHVMLL